MDLVYFPPVISFSNKAGDTFISEDHVLVWSQQEFVINSSRARPRLTRHCSEVDSIFIFCITIFMLTHTL